MKFGKFIATKQQDLNTVPDTNIMGNYAFEKSNRHILKRESDSLPTRHETNRYTNYGSLDSMFDMN
jgi:hypothetical protein